MDAFVSQQRQKEQVIRELAKRFREDLTRLIDHEVDKFIRQLRMLTDDEWKKLFGVPKSA